MWHSGSISTYKAHVWLYPDAGIGIFAALAGPQRYDTTDVLYNLMHAISDLVVFNVRPPDTQFTQPTPRTGTDDSGGQVPPRPLSDYAGVYVGQWLQMTATVTLEGDVLRLTLGRMLTAEVRRYDCVSDQFDAVIGGRLWWVAEGLPQRGVLSLRFRSSVPGGLPDVLELPLEIDSSESVLVRRSRFTRPDLRLADDWTPPGQGNTCSAAYFIGPQVWMFLTVIFSFFSF